MLYQSVTQNDMTFNKACAFIFFLKTDIAAEFSKNSFWPYEWSKASAIWLHYIQQKDDITIA